MYYAIADMKSLRSLSDFEVQWQWEGRGTMVMGRQDLEERYRSITYITNVFFCFHIFGRNTFFRAVFEQYVRTMEGCKINRDGILNVIKEKFSPGDLGMRIGDVNNVNTVCLLVACDVLLFFDILVFLFQ